MSIERTEQMSGLPEWDVYLSEAAQNVQFEKFLFGAHFLLFSFWFFVFFFTYWSTICARIFSVDAVRKWYGTIISFTCICLSELNSYQNGSISLLDAFQIIIIKEPRGKWNYDVRKLSIISMWMKIIEIRSMEYANTRNHKKKVGQTKIDYVEHRAQ